MNINKHIYEVVKKHRCLEKTEKHIDWNQIIKDLKDENIL